jgi:hypothetical protein
MKPRRTHRSNHVFVLPGGNEDNDLWVTVGKDTEDQIVLESVWELTYEEREAIYNGANVRLAIWGTGQPPVALAVTDEPLGRAPDASPGDG